MSTELELSTLSDVGSAPVATKTRVDRTAYLANLISARPAVDGPAWLKTLRDGAAAMAQELAIPTSRDEEWRFTDLSGLVAQTWQVASPTTDLNACDSIVVPEAGSRLVFLNGRLQPQLSKTTGLPAGVFVGNLADLPAELLPAVQAQLGKQPNGQEVFTALNTASFTDIAIVFVPKQVVVEQPIHLVFLSRTAGATTLAQPRCLVVAEAGSRLTLVEEFTAADTASAYFSNAVTEIVLAPQAQVNHTRVQWETAQAFHIGKTAVTQAQDSHYSCAALSLGGQLARHNLEIHQTGPGTETNLTSLTMVEGTSTADTHSLIAFTQPHGKANQLHKCIANGKGHGVFNGRIHVAKAAQLTDAAQLSRNLLLSPQARIDTKPQLEIVADNVKCAHGATVSQLEDDEVFYLQSRGIDGVAARKLLTFAFANEVIEKIPVPSLRAALTQWVRERNR
jgi:Fe-S cluster assembly protein SufD